MPENSLIASYQWANRPADERFWNVDEFAAAVQQRRAECQELTLRIKRFRAVPDSAEGFTLEDTLGAKNFVLSNLAFRQFANRLGVAPGTFRADLWDSDFMCAMINHRINKLDNDTDIQMLFRNGADNRSTIRCINSDSYARVWDAHLVPMLQRFIAAGWKVPPARPPYADYPNTRKATEADVLQNSRLTGGLKINVGDDIAPAGVYSGDRDSFIFLANDKDNFVDPMGRTIYGTLIITNSEVGEGSVGIAAAGTDDICGNHILWGFQPICDIRLRHTGDVMKRLVHYLTEWNPTEIMQNWGKGITPIFAWMNAKSLGIGKDECVDAVYTMIRNPILTKQVIGEAWDFAEQYRDVDGAPDTFGGMFRALTRYSQTLPNQDDRRSLDKAANMLIAAADRLMHRG